MISGNSHLGRRTFRIASKLVFRQGFRLINWSCRSARFRVTRGLFVHYSVSRNTDRHNVLSHFASYTPGERNRRRKIFRVGTVIYDVFIYRDMRYLLACVCVCVKKCTFSQSLAFFFSLHEGNRSFRRRNADSSKCITSAPTCD